MRVLYVLGALMIVYFVLSTLIGGPSRLWALIPNAVTYTDDCGNTRYVNVTGH